MQAIAYFIGDVTTTLQRKATATKEGYTSQWLRRNAGQCYPTVSSQLVPKDGTRYEETIIHPNDEHAAPLDSIQVGALLAVRERSLKAVLMSPALDAPGELQ